MRTKFIVSVVGAMLMVASSLLSESASAKEPDLYAPLEYNTLRLEPGLAVPFNTPQTDHYRVGEAASVKLDLHITPWVSVFPSVSFVALSIGDKYTSGGDVGTAWSFGLGLRLQRPHDYDNNPDHGLDAFSPWVDAEPVYVRTASLNRFGVQASAGIYFPTSDSRWLWTGPFIGYQEIIDGTQLGGDPTKDHTDSRLGIVGWGFEFDFGGHQIEQPVSQPETQPDVPEQVVTEVPSPQVEEPPIIMDVLFHGQSHVVVQFDFDDATLSEEYQGILTDFAHNVAVGFQMHPNMQVEIDGHASDEHHPWAEEHNQKLSEKRAQVVNDFLVQAGVPASVLTVKGFGTSKPIDTNDTDEGRAHNRRVEFEISVTLRCTVGKDCQ